MGKLPKPNKDLGQHFLKDQNVIANITSDFEDEYDVIVEIGPGPAILTKELSLKDKPLYLIEKDTRFEPLLKECTSHIYFEDALKFDWNEFVKQNELINKKIWLVSNLPYNISAPLFLSFQRIEQIKFMTLMFQKEVGEKTYFKQNTKNQMSSLMAISNTFFETKLLMKVLPGAFNPPPKVDSVVVSYKRVERPKIPLSEFSRFESFLRLIFKFKRKQLGSVLKANVDIQEFFSKTNIERTRRAESLMLDEIYELYNLYS